MYKVLDDMNSDGVVLGQSPAAKVGFFGQPAIPQRSNPMQANIQGMNGGQLVTAAFAWTPVGVSGQQILEQYFAITPTIGTFCATSDFLLGVIKSTMSPTTGLGIAGLRISCTNQLAINWANPSAAPISPSTEFFTAIIAQGFPVISQVITPNGVPSLSQNEQIFTIQGSGAVGAAILNNAGQVSGVYISNGGSNYINPPELLFGGGPPLGGVTGPQVSTTLLGNNPAYPLNFAAPGAGNQVGAFGGDYPAATATAPYGSGAAGICVVSGGAVIGVVMTSPGAGYQIAPAVSFAGGNTFSLGMVAHVNKPSATTGLGIGNVRVVGPYQIGITFINNTITPITPIGETYRFLVTNELPAISNVMQYVWASGTPIMALTGVATGATVEAPVTMPGILTTDLLMGLSKPTITTNIAVGTVRVGAASVLQITLSGPSCATIPAGEYWNLGLWRQQPVAPTAILNPYLGAPTAAITAAGTFEISQTITGVPLGANVVVNKSTHTQGLSITNARVSAANTVQISYQNMTAVAICLPAFEFYTVEVFNQPIGAVGNGLAESWHIQSVMPSFNQAIDLTNEQEDTLCLIGMDKGY